MTEVFHLAEELKDLAVIRLHPLGPTYSILELLDDRSRRAFDVGHEYLRGAATEGDLRAALKDLLQDEASATGKSLDDVLSMASNAVRPDTLLRRVLKTMLAILEASGDTTLSADMREFFRGQLEDIRRSVGSLDTRLRVGLALPLVCAGRSLALLGHSLAAALI
jgi:hypothetical protein